MKTTYLHSQSKLQMPKYPSLEIELIPANRVIDGQKLALWKAKCNWMKSSDFRHIEL